MRQKKEIIKKSPRENHVFKILISMGDFLSIYGSF